MAEIIYDSAACRDRTGMLAAHAGRAAQGRPPAHADAARVAGAASAGLPVPAYRRIRRA